MQFSVLNFQIIIFINDLIGLIFKPRFIKTGPEVFFENDNLKYRNH